MDDNKQYHITLLSEDAGTEYSITVIKHETEEGRKIEPSQCSCERKKELSIKDILDKSYGYIPLIAYTFVFVLISLFYNAWDCFGLYYTALSVIMLIVDKLNKKGELSNTKKNLIILASFLTALIGIPIGNKFLPNIFRNFLINLISAVILFIDIVHSMKEIMANS